jgi:hypothetical protein
MEDEDVDMNFECGLRRYHKYFHMCDAVNVRLLVVCLHHACFIV